MKIERFRVQNYKNLKDVTIENLSDVNIFFGHNNVGKSNTFEALALTLWLLQNAQEITPPDSQKILNWVITSEMLTALAITPPFEPLDGQNPLLFELTLRWNLKDIAKVNEQLMIGFAMNYEIGYREVVISIAIKATQQNSDRLLYSIEYSWEDDLGSPINEAINLHSLKITPSLQIIHANRRLNVERREVERRESGNGLKAINHHNLKTALFYAYLSSDMRQKRRFEAIRRVLSEPPFELGFLDVALGPEIVTDGLFVPSKIETIDIGFVRSDGRLPIENLGSGSQQLLLILGQIFLNDSPLVALEEPEMNLSPQYQQHLLTALRRLMQDPAVALEQLFISTHSPYLEFAENFYDVTLDKQGHTQIVRATPREHARHFAIAPLGPETGARLNSLNQIQLYQGVLDDLDLQRGDMVFFVKDEAGRWEIRPESEVLDKMKAAWSDNGGGE